MNKIVCVNDSNRPNVIPKSKWIKKGSEYTVLEACKCNVQGGLLGFKIEEVDLSGCEPYLYFSAHRFGIVAPDNTNEEQKEEVETFEDELVA